MINLKNFFSILGTFTLVTFGILFTNSTVDKLKNEDDIMVQIKAVSSHYSEKPEEGVSIENGIIPGISGREVNIDESYSKMKRLGYFNKELLVYDKKHPKNTLKDNYNKYIIKGNSTKQSTSLIILIEKNTKIEDLEKILDIAKLKNIKLNFFIDGYWFEENNDIINKIVMEKHELGNLSYDGDYQDSSFIWMDTIIKKITEKKYSFCYKEKENKLHLETCSLYKNYTIIPSIIIDNNLYNDVKNKISSGDIISLKVTDKNINELPSTITYIESKGLKIVTLSNLLKE